MKKSRYIRKLDSLGRLCLPKELRKRLMINDGDSVEIFVEGDTICIKGVKIKDDILRCISCDSDKNLLQKDGINMCKDCVIDFFYRGLGFTENTI